MRSKKKERKLAQRRRGFGDDLFYNLVEKHDIRVGDVFEAEIQETDPGGFGIVRIGKLIIKIPNAKFGSRMKLKITEIEGRNALAEVIRPQTSTDTQT